MRDLVAQSPFPALLIHSFPPKKNAGNGLVSAPSAAAPSGAVAVATKAGILRCQAPNIYRIDNNSQRRVRVYVRACVAWRWLWGGPTGGLDSMCVCVSVCTLAPLVVVVVF